MDNIETTLLKIFMCEVIPAFFESRNGIKGHACSFVDKNGVRCERDGFGHEKRVSAQKFYVYGKSLDGKVYKSDLNRSLKYNYDIKNKEQLKTLQNHAKKGLKLCDGEIMGSHYPNSTNFWISDIQKLVNLGETFSKYTDFKNENESFSINDLD